MNDLLVPIVATLASIVGAIVTAIVARQKGLPGINKEIESRIQALNDLLTEQLEAANREIVALKAAATECKAALRESRAENDRLARREMILTADLLRLYQQTGNQPPKHLTENGK